MVKMTDDLKDTMGRVLEAIRVREPGTDGQEAPAARACGTPAWEFDTALAHPCQAFCDGVVHLRGGVVACRCPKAVEAEVRGRVDEERKRLAVRLEHLRRGGGDGFDGYDPARLPKAGEALEAMKRFAGSRVPPRNVLLVGETGTGKTRLLMASHLERLGQGWASEYLSTAEMRPLFREAVSYAEGSRRQAQAEIARLAAAPALHLDDLGDVKGSQAFHADFAVGLKGLLDTSRGRLAVGLNLGFREAQAHPDLGDRIVSRICEDAEIVRMEGRDQRLTGSRAPAAKGSRG